jgi:hypothetical protein
MDRCEDDVIIACGLYLLAEEEKRKKKELKYWIHEVFRAREEEGDSHTVSTPESERQIFFKYFRMSFSKFENLKKLLHTGIEKKDAEFWLREISKYL